MTGQNPGLGPDKVGLADCPARNLFGLFPNRFLVAFGRGKLRDYDLDLCSYYDKTTPFYIYERITTA